VKRCCDAAMSPGVLDRSSLWTLRLLLVDDLE
jgi:hypothetical protein